VGSFHFFKKIIKKFNCSWFNYSHVINSGFQPDTFTAPIITRFSHISNFTLTFLVSFPICYPHGNLDLPCSYECVTLCESKGKIGNMRKALFKHGCRKSPDLTALGIVFIGECYGVCRTGPYIYFQKEASYFASFKINVQVFRGQFNLLMDIFLG
jgi:hypothetical protein